MSKFEIHSSSGNYYLDPSVCSVDTSDIGPNSTPGEFMGVRLSDVVVAQLQSKSWSVPGEYLSESTADLNLSHAEIKKLIAGISMCTNS